MFDIRQGKKYTRSLDLGTYSLVITLGNFPLADQSEIPLLAKKKCNSCPSVLMFLSCKEVLSMRIIFRFLLSSL